MSIILLPLAISTDRSTDQPCALDMCNTARSFKHLWHRSNTANPTDGDIFECCFKAQSSKLERLFSLKRGKRDVRALSFELSKMSPQVGLAVHV